MNIFGRTSRSSSRRLTNSREESQATTSYDENGRKSLDDSGAESSSQARERAMHAPTASPSGRLIMDDGLGFLRRSTVAYSLAPEHPPARDPNIVAVKHSTHGATTSVAALRPHVAGETEGSKRHHSRHAIVDAEGRTVGLATTSGVAGGETGRLDMSVPLMIPKLIGQKLLAVVTRILDPNNAKDIQEELARIEDTVATPSIGHEPFVIEDDNSVDGSPQSVLDAQEIASSPSTSALDANPRVAQHQQLFHGNSVALSVDEWHALTRLKEMAVQHVPRREPGDKPLPRNRDMCLAMGVQMRDSSSGALLGSPLLAVVGATIPGDAEPDGVRVASPGLTKPLRGGGLEQLVGIVGVSLRGEDGSDFNAARVPNKPEK